MIIREVVVSPVCDRFDGNILRPIADWGNDLNITVDIAGEPWELRAIGLTILNPFSDWVSVDVPLTQEMIDTLNKMKTTLMIPSQTIEGLQHVLNSMSRDDDCCS